jgi:DNA-binding MarR family transcriptional regulator
VNDERRTLMKLSADGRAVWTRIQDAYASPTNAAQRSLFDVIRAKQRALPANQQRYIRRLVRMHRDRFQRVALLSLTPDEFNDVVDRAETPEQLAALALLLPFGRFALAGPLRSG